MDFIKRRFFSFLLVMLILSTAHGESRPEARPNLEGDGNKAVAETEDNLKIDVPSFDAILQASGLKAVSGVVVADLKTGEILESHQADLALPPASVVKAVTSGYAMDHLGPAFQFETRLLATGPIRAGVLQGDLIFAGGGDPQLDTDTLVRMIETLEELGVKKVEGKFYVWAGGLPYQRYISPKQGEHLNYNTSVSGLNLNYNNVNFIWKLQDNGYKTEIIAESANYKIPVTSITAAVAVRDLPVYIYEDRSAQEYWSVANSALGESGQRRLPVRYSHKLAAEVFHIMAQNAGIEIPKAMVLDALPLVSELVVRRSNKLPIMLGAMLQYSNNLMAETIGLKASYASGENVTALSESAELMSKWARLVLGDEALTLVDHSGLSDASRMSSRQLVRFMQLSPQIHSLMKDFAISTKKAPRVYPAAIKVNAKTGTLNFVKTLSGVITGGERDLAFAILSADMKMKSSLTKAQSQNPPGAKEFTEDAFALQRALLWRWANEYAARK